MAIKQTAAVDDQPSIQVVTSNGHKISIRSKAKENADDAGQQLGVSWVLFL